MALLLVLLTNCQPPDTWELTSEDGNITFLLLNQDSVLSYAVVSDDSVLVEETSLGVLIDSTHYASGARFIAASMIDDIGHGGVNPRHAYREQTFSFSAVNGEMFSFVVRVYNEGVFFRFRNKLWNTLYPLADDLSQV
jgi:hypothetical protein